MTRQQAGVSAEAVAKLVAKWRERGSELARRGEVSVTLYAEGMRLQLCADELEALATAPPPEHKGMMISDSRKQEAHERIMERQPATPYSLHCAQIRNDALEEAATLCTNQEAYDNDSEDPVMAEKIRALKTVATAPPEQAEEVPEYIKVLEEGLDEQAAIAGAMNPDGLLTKEDLLALDGLQKTHPNLWRHIRECGQAVLELQKREGERRAVSAGALESKK